MGSFFDIFKFKSNNQSAIDPTKEILNNNFVLHGNVYRNHDNSIPELEQFLDLGLSVDDYVFYVHGESQSDLQDRIGFELEVAKSNKKRSMEKRLKIKASKVKKQPRKINAFEDDLYSFGMFAPFGFYYAANNFGLNSTFIDASYNGFNPVLAAIGYDLTAVSFNDDSMMDSSSMSMDSNSSLF